MTLQERVGRLEVDALDVDLDRALPELFAYVLHRCGSRVVAEDVASESSLAAVDQLCGGAVNSIGIGYLIGIARRKLVDHWRREEREIRHLQVFAGGRADSTTDDQFEPGRASSVLSGLNSMQRAAVTLRYVDDLPVSDVARRLGRSVHATETLPWAPSTASWPTGTRPTGRRVPPRRMARLRRPPGREPFYVGTVSPQV